MCVETTKQLRFGKSKEPILKEEKAAILYPSSHIISENLDGVLYTAVCLLCQYMYKN